MCISRKDYQYLKWEGDIDKLWVLYLIIVGVPSIDAGYNTSKLAILWNFCTSSHKFAKIMD